MSSSENKLPRSPKMTSSSKARTDAAASPAPPPSSSAETLMDQSLDSTLIDPSAPHTPPEVMSSTVPAPPNPPANPIPPNPPANSSSTPPSPPSAEVHANGDQPSSAPTTEAAPSPAAQAEEAIAISRQQPIPPASEPMQYRAIGLVRGKYTPSEEQFTRGTLLTDDGTPIDAVLLGRVMSLVKKHLDLEQPHLWVVYPRTNEREYSLHVQIVGVWEPENLKKVDIDAEETEPSDEPTEELTEESTAEAAAVESSSEMLVDDSLDLDDRYFSVRGEVVFYSPESEQLLVKIRRSPRQGSDQSKAFKVVLKGKLEGKSVGYFWDFNVKREANLLVVQDATLIKIVPPQKGGGEKPRGGPRRGAPSGARKPWGNREGGRPTREGSPRPQRGDRPTRPLQRDRSERPEPVERKEPISKPIIKRRDKDASS